MRKKNEDTKDSKKNRISLISRVAGIVVILLVGTLYMKNADSTSYKDENVQIWTEERLSKEHKMEYAVLDISVIEEDESLNKWYEKNVKKVGLSTMNHDGFTYFMVSGGLKKTPGFAIQLFDVKEGKHEVYVGYNVLSPEETQTKNENKLPHMIIRIKETEKPIRERVISDDERVEKNK